MKKIVVKYWYGESGAVTVDWVVLTAAIVGLGIAVLTSVSGGTMDLANDTEDLELRAVRSYDAVTMRVPSGENAALCRPSSWPRRTVISAPVPASQIRAVLSSDAAWFGSPSNPTFSKENAFSCILWLF